jgi:hypothetical protein
MRKRMELSRTDPIPSPSFPSMAAVAGLAKERDLRTEAADDDEDEALLRVASVELDRAASVELLRVAA